MRRIRQLSILILILTSLFLLVACKPKTYTVTLIYQNQTKELSFKEGEIFKGEEIKIDGYVFIGWLDAENKRVTNYQVNQNITFVGKYIKEGTTYKINYELNGGELPDEYPVEYTIGDEITLPNPYGFGDMTFLGWYVNDEMISSITKTTYGNLNLVAKWDDKNVYYELNYELDGGTLEEGYKTRYVEGSIYVLPIPTKDGYLFKGWYTDSEYQNRIKKITKEDKQSYTLYARFEERIRENMYISFLGDSITTYAGYIPDGFATYYPTPGCDVDSVEKTWWHQVVAKTGYKLLVNNSYSGTQVSGGTNFGNSYDRLKYLSKDGIDPDIIVIHMGTNDFTHGVNVTKFKSAYGAMIDKIKEEYDDVEIYIINLPYNKYAQSFVSPREKYNVALKELSEEKNVELIDITEGINKNNVHLYMFAGAHPNYAGMTYMADIIWKRIL